MLGRDRFTYSMEYYNPMGAIVRAKRLCTSFLHNKRTAALLKTVEENRITSRMHYIPISDTETFRGLFVVDDHRAIMQSCLDRKYRRWKSAYAFFLELLLQIY